MRPPLWVMGIVVAVGAIALALGVLLLTQEVTLFRFTTQDHDFTGLTCGTPLDNPGWEVGSPCDGAVSRQRMVAGMTVLAGVGTLITGGILLVGHVRTKPPPA
jgi:hypothetical protein